MNVLSINFNSQVFQAFAASASLASRPQEIAASPPQPQGSTTLPASGAESGGAPAVPDNPSPEQLSAVTATSQTASFFELNIRMRLAEKGEAPDNDRREQEPERRVHHLIKKIGRAVHNQLRDLRKETPGLTKAERTDIKDISKEFRNELKQLFRAASGKDDDTTESPLRLGPGDLLSSVRSAFDQLLSRLEGLLNNSALGAAGVNSTEPSDDTAGSSSGNSQTALATPTGSPAPTAGAPDSTPEPSLAEAVALTTGSADNANPTDSPAAPASTSTSDQVTPVASGPRKALSLLEELRNIVDELVASLSDILTPTQATAKESPQAAFTTQVDFTFAFFSQSSFQFSSISTGENINAVA